MDFFHSHVQIISRGKGKSAVSAAAYRAGETITNNYDGIVHDYTRKRGVIHTEILLPDHAPREYTDRAVLWNAVEKIERAENAQLAREFDISLPAEFTHEQNIALTREYVQRTFVDAGMCADFCFHDKGDGNPHFHLMLTMRPLNENGSWGGKQKKEYTLDRDGNKIYDPIKRQYKCRSIPSTDWNKHGNADKWREIWENMVNAESERLRFDFRIDRRTYAEQGIEKIPTVHMGASASQMEQRGIRTERGDMNREIAITNKQIQQLRARMNKLSDWLKEEAGNPAPPTLADVLQEILSRPGQSSLTHVKNGAEILYFIQSNKIDGNADLNKMVDVMQSNLNSASSEIKKVERRIDTLKEHLRQSGYFKEHRSLKRQYDRLYSQYTNAKNETGFFAARNTKKALEAVNDFYEANRTGLTLFDAAEKYLRDHLQKHYDPKKLPPISDWEKELAKKLAEKDTLYQKYYKLKEDTSKIEKIQRSVKEILHSGEPKPERVKSKSYGMEL